MTSRVLPNSFIRKDISSKNHSLDIAFTLVHKPVFLRFIFFDFLTNSFLALILSLGEIPSSRLPSITSDFFEISSNLSVTFFKCGGKK